MMLVPIISFYIAFYNVIVLTRIVLRIYVAQGYWKGHPLHETFNLDINQQFVNGTIAKDYENS